LNQRGNFLVPKRHLFPEQGNGAVIVVRVAVLSGSRFCRMSILGDDPRAPAADC
jgi:hypothetical protein